MSTGVIVAGMQVHELNSLHRKIIEDVMKKHERIIMLLRASRVPSTKNNPLDVETRKVLMKETFNGLNVLSIDDHPLPSAWSSKLDELVKQHAQGDVVLYGTRKDLLDEYSGQYSTEALADAFSGRDEVNNASEEERASKLFRKGMLYAIGKQYAKVFPTVDIAIFREGKLLLAKKPGVSGYRFIGGFTDPGDECYEDAAAREAFEETGIEVKDVSYIGSMKVDDWRYRKEQDKIITNFFKAEYSKGDPSPQDDISELKWFSMKELEEEMFVDEHKPLYRIMINKMNNA